MDTIIKFYDSQTETIQMWLGLVMLFSAAFMLRFIASKVIHQLSLSLRTVSKNSIYQSILDARLIRRLVAIIPSLVAQFCITLVSHLPSSASEIIRNIAFALTIFHFVRIVDMLLNIAVEQSQHINRTTRMPALKSSVQLVKLLMYLGCGIIIIAVLINRSPLIVLSGMGALSAVLMLVFKDTILSFTAGILIATNDMLHEGDWIEMPQCGADGDVTDISLHTIKVQNWDKTITTIPTWKLVSESYKNWRGMQDSGGRRIKRSILIDANTIRFLKPEEIAKLEQINILSDYLHAKLDDIHKDSAAKRSTLGELAQLPINQRRLTNIGTFRAYIEAYLKNHPNIHKGMTLMVRQMAPSPEGVPIELYCFTNTTKWADYENIQSDIFEHLSAYVAEFELSISQVATGQDIRAALTQKQAV